MLVREEKKVYIKKVVRVTEEGDHLRISKDSDESDPGRSRGDSNNQALFALP